MFWVDLLGDFRPNRALLGLCIPLSPLLSPHSSRPFLGPALPVWGSEQERRRGEGGRGGAAEGSRRTIAEEEVLGISAP